MSDTNKTSSEEEARRCPVVPHAEGGGVVGAEEGVDNEAVVVVSSVVVPYDSSRSSSSICGLSTINPSIGKKTGGKHAAARKGLGGGVKVGESDLKEATRVNEAMLHDTPTTTKDRKPNNVHNNQTHQEGGMGEKNTSSVGGAQRALAPQASPTSLSAQQPAAIPVVENIRKEDRFSGLGSESVLREKSKAAVPVYNPADYAQVNQPNYEGIGTRDDLDPNSTGRKRRKFAEAVWSIGDSLKNLKEKASEKKAKAGKKIENVLNGI